MTGSEIRDVFLSCEFKQGLEELSSYLASIARERPIVHLLAKCLWFRKIKFELEHQKQDLTVNGKRIEFKFNYDRCQEDLTHELERHGDNLKGMWALVELKQISKSWGVMPKIYEDVCVRTPPTDLFVWIICSRDLSKLSPDDVNRICAGREQRRYNATHPYVSDGEPLTVVDSYLDRLQAVRPFSLIKQDIQTNGDFPSTYHFRICDFAS